MKDLTSLTLTELGRLATKDLLALYNAHAPKRIDRFADHFSGFRRTKALLLAQGKLLTLAVSVAPKANAPAHKKARTKVLVAPLSKPESTKEYHSVLAAFKALNLPVVKHQRFRQQVKRNGKAAFAQFVFTATY